MVDDFGPAGLSARERLCGLKIFECLVIGEYREGLIETFQVVSPEFHSRYNRKKFFVVYFIVEFGRAHLAGHKSDWTELFSVILGEDSGDSEVGRVCFNNSFQGWIEMSEDICALESLFYIVESFFSSVILNKGVVFLEKSGQGKNDAGIALDETAVKVCEAQKLLDIADFSWCRPGENGIDLV
jgi:hypothetical protein